jgi:hypothetical protein
MNSHVYVSLIRDANLGAREGFANLIPYDTSIENARHRPHGMAIACLIIVQHDSRDARKG